MAGQFVHLLFCAHIIYDIRRLLGARGPLGNFGVDIPVCFGVRSWRGAVHRQSSPVNQVIWLSLFPMDHVWMVSLPE